MTDTVASPMTKGAHRIEIFTGAGRRRPWSMAEKAAIVAESCVPGANVSEVARRHGLVPSQLFRWRQLARARADKGELMPFVPVVVSGAESALALSASAVPQPAPAMIEIETRAARVRLPAGIRPTTVLAIVKALRVRS
jgi:transposase